MELEEGKGREDGARKDGRLKGSPSERETPSTSSGSAEGVGSHWRVAVGRTRKRGRDCKLRKSRRAVSGPDLPICTGRGWWCLASWARTAWGCNAAAVLAGEIPSSKFQAQSGVLRLSSEEAGFLGGESAERRVLSPQLTLAIQCWPGSASIDHRATSSSWNCKSATNSCGNHCVPATSMSTAIPATISVSPDAPDPSVKSSLTPDLRKNPECRLGSSRPCIE